MRRLLNHVHKIVEVPGSNVKLVEDVDLYEEIPTPLRVKILRTIGALLVIVIITVVGIRVIKGLSKFPTPKPVSAIYYY